MRNKAYAAWKYDGKVLSDEELSKIGQSYINPIITQIYPEFIDFFQPFEIAEIIYRAVEHYKYQWSELYEGAKPAEVLENE